MPPGLPIAEMSHGLILNRASMLIDAVKRKAVERFGVGDPSSINHCAQALLSSRCRSGDFFRSDGFVIRLRPAISLGLQTGNSCSVQRRTASRPLRSQWPCLTATSTSSRTKSI